MEDQNIVLIIGGIEVSLPSSRGEMSTDIVGETKGYLEETIKRDKEKALMFSPLEGEEHSVEFLEIFSREAKQGITTKMEVVAE